MVLEQFVAYKLKKKNSNLNLLPYIKVIQNKNHKAIKFLEENIRENLHDLKFGKELLNMTSNA